MKLLGSEEENKMRVTNSGDQHLWPLWSGLSTDFS